MSMPLSWAARRRTICSRWPSAPFGSFWYLMTYWPWLWLVHVSTACCTAPELSG